ncbi:hypothetical protein PRN20_03465 [Devosia sp. ZB163]|uniref:hypothetical protein n=1 Tax=Devosia sp. ZB163 TaxID=3025938 RepID=UPI0023629EA3|nr:hypothetical protein [Devosia sp. ZB163]MDC9822781.1 hypothetical protein [Devosia sp. ZB163]
MNKKRKEPYEVISATTVNAKYLSAVSGFFDYLVSEEKVLAVNPAADIKSLQEWDDGDALLNSEKRMPFKPEHILTLKAITLGKPHGSIDRWWFPLRRKVGLRLEEATSLSVADFRMHHGRMCIDLLHHDDGDPDNAARRRQLEIKTEAGRRVLPLHGSILDEGILELVEKRRRRMVLWRCCFRMSSPTSMASALEPHQNASTGRWMR